MFRRILNWLKESFGGATTPEEVCTLRMMQMKWEGPVAMVPGEANAAKFSDVLDDHWKTLVLARALRKKLDEPLVELTATETKVEQYARLSREITCECVRHNGGTERSSELLAALNVLRLKMTLGDVSRAAMSLRKSPD